MNTSPERSRGAAARETRFSVLAALLVVMITVGAVQNAVVAQSAQLSRATLVDDLLLLVAFGVSVLRLVRRHQSQLLAVGAYILLCSVALVRATVELGLAFEIFRQLVVPCLLVAVGLSLTRREWRAVLLTWNTITLVNIVYMLIEKSAGPMISPTDFLRNSGTDDRVLQIGGLPGSYTYWDAEGHPALRVGGLFLNPPIAGLAVAIGTVVIVNTSRSRLRWLVLAAAGFAVYYSFSRAGMLVLAAGVIVPLLIRYLGGLVAAVLSIAGGVLFFTQFSDDGGSEAHIDGLTSGIDAAFSAPLGIGFGTAGNIIKTTLQSSESSESLTGILLIGAGLPALVFVAVVAWSLARAVRRSSAAPWESVLALTGLIVAAVAETAGALAGAAPMWIAAGLALGQNARARRARARRTPPAPHPRSE